MVISRGVGLGVGLGVGVGVGVGGGAGITGEGIGVGLGVGVGVGFTVAALNVNHAHEPIGSGLFEVVVAQAEDELGSDGGGLGTAIDGFGADDFGGVVGTGSGDGFIFTQGIAGIGSRTAGESRACYRIYLGGAGTGGGGELIQGRDGVESGVLVGSGLKHHGGLARHRHRDGIGACRDVLGVIELIGLRVTLAIVNLARDVCIGIASGIGDGSNLNSGIAPIDGEDNEVADGVRRRKGERQGFGGGAIAGIVADGLHEGDGCGSFRDDLSQVEVGGRGGVSQLQDAEDADKDGHYCQDGDVGGKASLGSSNLRRLHTDAYAHMYP
jgi:hypothetical protein